MATTTETGLYYYAVNYTSGSSTFTITGTTGTNTTSVVSNEAVLSKGDGAVGSTKDVYDTEAKVYNAYIGSVTVKVGTTVYHGYLVQDTGANGTTTNGAYYIFLSVPSGTAPTLSASDTVTFTPAGAPGTSGNWDAATGSASCFLAGTAIATPAGDVAVESLKTGDLVTLADGRVAPVAWLGINTVSTRFADNLRALPIRIQQNALGEGLPARDLLISPDHALFLDGILVQAGALINGSSITREHDVPEIFSYYHVEVADHSLILAENVPAETFVDNVSRMAFDNWAEHQAVFGDQAEVPEMQFPRAKSARQLPPELAARLGIGAAVQEALVA